MGPGGNSVSAAQAKLSKTEKTRPARSENPSLMIYTRVRSDACYAVGEAPATPLVYLRSLAGHLSTTKKVPAWPNIVE